MRIAANYPSLPMSSKKDVLVIVHDAGASEVIGAYVQAHTKGFQYFVYASGPAEKIFKRIGLAFKRVQDERAFIARIMQKHKNASFALLGTGWMTTIDSIALKEAKAAGLKTIVYLDSWGDYRVRFGYPHKGWRKNMPDELWCGDSHSLSLARTYFPEVSSRLERNLYVRGSVERTRVLRSKRTPSYVLFVSRPNAHSDALAGGIAENFSKREHPPTLRIRLHPAEKTHAWVDVLTQKYRGRVRIEKSRTVDIAEDISGACAVVGRETFAMVISALSGIRTIRIERGFRLLLPYRAITHVRTAAAAASLI